MVDIIMAELQLARLLQLCSPALPVGAYAYSSGLEAAVDDATVSNLDEAEAWIQGVFCSGVAELDLPALFIACTALSEGNPQLLNRLDEYLQASRESSELLLEDQQMGRSLNRLAVSLGMESPDRPRPSFITTFAVAGVHWGIEPDDLACGYAFSWLENQVGVAIKTVPLGQSEAQSLLAVLSELIGEAVTRAAQIASSTLNNSDAWSFGQSLPGLAILSSRHEQQSSRLYRS